MLWNASQTNYRMWALRVWIVASVFWAILVGAEAYSAVTVPRTHAAQALAKWTKTINDCVIAEKLANVGKGFYEPSCFDGPPPDADVGSYWHYFFRLMGRPLASFAIGVAALWIFSKFRQFRFGSP
jgi:hypothetical protein